MYLNVESVKENKDGSAILTVSYDSDFTDLIKKIYKRKKCTKKLLQTAIITALENGLIEKEREYNT